MKNQSYTIIKSREQYDRYCDRLEEMVENETNPNALKATQVSLFKYVPSVSYNFKF